MMSTAILVSVIPAKAGIVRLRVCMYSGVRVPIRYTLSGLYSTRNLRRREAGWEATEGERSVRQDNERVSALFIDEPAIQGRSPDSAQAERCWR